MFFFFFAFFRFCGDLVQFCGNLEDWGCGFAIVTEVSASLKFFFVIWCGRSSHARLCGFAFFVFELGYLILGVHTHKTKKRGDLLGILCQKRALFTVHIKSCQKLLTKFDSYRDHPKINCIR